MYGRVDLSQSGLILYASLDLEQNVRLPIVQLGHLIKLKDGSCECLDIACLNSVNEDIDEFGLPRRRKGRVQGGVLPHVALGSDSVLSPQVCQPITT